jgi:hypothetical protein
MVKININKVELKLTDTDDPIASQIEWTPSAGGGSNFKTSEIEAVDDRILVIKPSHQLKLVKYFMLGIPLFISSMAFISIVIADGQWFGMIFVIAGLWFMRLVWNLFKHIETVIYFDKTKGLVYKDVKQTPPKSNFFPSTVPLSEKLSDVHALQIIGEHVSSRSSKGRTSNYVSYELNLVMKDLRRFTVMDHGNNDKLIQAAEQLSDFLNVPIWDAT